MNFTPADDLVDEVWGKMGTPERNAMEAQLKEDIKKVRQLQNLTQEELGEKVGVKKSQISKLESGKCVITLPTMSRIFRALGIATASLDLGAIGKVTLW